MEDSYGYPINHNRNMILETPTAFSYEECLSYLSRSDLELTYRINGREIRKLLKIKNQPYLISIRPAAENNHLEIACLNDRLSGTVERTVIKYVREWFDLESPIEAFYEAAAGNDIFKRIVQRHYGLRLIQIPDLFEAMSWAIIGQQINLNFAYKIKHALITRYGESIQFEGQAYYLFPSPDKIADLTAQELREIQFSRQKAEYITLLARSILNREVSRKKLLRQNMEGAAAQIKKLKGFGEWSAQYVLMRCLGFKEALPAQDAGLKNALRYQYQLDQQPSAAEVTRIARPWSPWQAYYTFYLWRTLLTPA